jgi:hypothetical protein
MATKYVDVVFDGPPGPVTGRFIETEDDQGNGWGRGSWHDRGDGTWALRIPVAPKRPIPPGHLFSFTLGCNCIDCKAARR